MEEKEQIPWRELTPHDRTILTAYQRKHRKGKLVWNSKNGTFRGSTKDL